MVSVATFGAEVLGVSREVWFLLQSSRLPSLLPLGVLLLCVVLSGPVINLPFIQKKQPLFLNHCVLHQSSKV